MPGAPLKQQAQVWALRPPVQPVSWPVGMSRATGEQRHCHCLPSSKGAKKMRTRTVIAWLCLTFVIMTTMKPFSDTLFSDIVVSSFSTCERRRVLRQMPCQALGGKDMHAEFASRGCADALFSAQSSAEVEHGSPLAQLPTHLALVNNDLIGCRKGLALRCLDGRLHV